MQFERIVRNGLLWSLLLALGGWATSANGQSRELRWRLREGDAFQLRMTQLSRSRLSFNDEPSELSMSLGVDMRWRVREIQADKSLRIALSFQRLRLRSIAPDSKVVTFDSASDDGPDPETRALARTMQPLLDSRFTLVLSPLGQIRAVQPDAETKRLLEQVPSAAPWKSLLTEAGMNRMFRQLLGVLPQEPVSANDHWTDRYGGEADAMKHEILNEYRYVGTVTDAGRTLDEIQVETRVTDKSAADAAEPAAIAGETRHSGRFLFDNERGYLSSARRDQTMNGEVVVRERRMQIQTQVTGTLQLLPEERD